MEIVETKRISYRNDVFFKCALSRDDENSIFIRNSIIEAVTGIKPMKSEVLNPNIDASIMNKKGIILDVHIQDEEGREYDVEMQNTRINQAENKRFEFYGARMLNEQLAKGEDYINLKPVYQILFVEGISQSSQELVVEYQMRTKDGKEEYESALIHRTYIQLPYINEMVKTRRIEEMSAFEQACYLFENNENDDILKSRERLVKELMEKYKNMREDYDLWSTAMAIEMGEMRTKHYIEDSFMMGKQEGKKEGLRRGEILGKIKLMTALKEIVAKQIKLKFGHDETEWLSTKTQDELEKISESLLTCQTIEELKENMK